MTKPLEGVRVLDLSQLTSGPLGTMVMAEQGAEVIKVEPPGFGDLFRLSSFNRNGFSALLLNHNRGKRSIAVDITCEAGRAIILELIAGSDVVVQNFRPGVMDRLGLGYDDAKAVNEHVIYVSISGYGPTGPYAKRPVVDPIIQALTGFVTRQQSEAIPLPDLVRNIVVDKATGLTVAQSICAALYHRAQTGLGDHLVVPMLDVGLYFFWPDGMMDHTLVGDGVFTGVTLADTYSLTTCADGQIIYYAPTNDMRLRLYKLLGHPEMCEDERFNNIMGLMEGDNFLQLGAILVSAFEKFPVADILQKLHEAEIPAAPILTAEEVIVDEQIVHNQAVVEWEHPLAGVLRQPRHPVRFASSETPVPQNVPGLGEHTDEILRALGRNDEEIAKLREAGSVA